MISTLLPLHKMIANIDKTTPCDGKKKDNSGGGMFSIHELFNPLSSFESDTDNDDYSSDWSSCFCAHCHDCEVVTKYEEDNEGIIRCKRCAAIAATEKRRRRVRFAASNNNNDDDDIDVVVHFIPSHRDYTDEEYYGMWHHPDELFDNTHRNRIEYKYEGHWKMAYEEDQFILCSDGKYYHPVTVRLYLRQLQRQKKEQQQHTNMGKQREQEQRKEQEEGGWGLENNRNDHASNVNHPMRKSPKLEKVAEKEEEDDGDDDTISSTSTTTSCSSSCSSLENQITQTKQTTCDLQPHQQQHIPTTNIVVVPPANLVADTTVPPRLIACVA